MSKKLFGGASLLIFVMTLLVFTNDSYSDDNRKDWYEYVTNYVCLSGEIAFSSTRWEVVTWSQNHPADNCRWERECWDVFNWDTNRWEQECWWIRVCHVDHWTTHRVYEDYHITTRSATPNRCRRFR